MNHRLRETNVPWIGSVPDTWNIVPANGLFIERKQRNEPEDVHLTPSQKYGVLPQAEYMQITGNKVVLNLTGADNMRHVEPGDFISHLRSFQGGLEYSEIQGKVSAAYTVITRRTKISGAYYKYLFKSAQYVQALQTTTDQLRDGQSIRMSQFKQIPLPQPPLDEQQEIAEYLDRETAQIDAFIAKNEELIALLTERRVAAINREFQNQPSNARIDHACESVVDCPHTTPPFDEDGEFEAVRTASVRDGKFRPNQGIRVNRRTWLDRNGSRGPRIGDILFTREAPAGEACMVPSTQICLGQRMVLLRIDPSKAHGDFVLWQLYSHKVATHFERAANGSTVTNIRLPLLRATPIWLPSLDTQSNVLQRLKAVGDKTDAAIATAHSAIELAKERRAALISAAVTGKIDVSKEAVSV